MAPHDALRREQSTSHQQLLPQPPSALLNRRDRRLKTSYTEQKQPSVSKAVAPRVADKLRTSVSSIDSSLSATDNPPSNSDKKTRRCPQMPRSQAARHRRSADTGGRHRCREPVP
ncbi:uncharacterized protein VDAG_05253 [Verticillium dahliae VdLs.17]|uniref:Uncharacterized protein n=1 Tax=Verticillium dahliae (strain VdLs.17 / ATCC MYA-4575 / FGSC 10137) TaxID=498257 RepID=G2X521_VERDV|nr:uncharacterized protein VDAG_05253 [Verticillium dahliae VdLs.17]EGY23815.1 hypothetical protein VDAG_05253 [Verticillium dahliae VdLs.17]KAH6699610.1 hypothetical protein EV126DRAFT_45806 [Verticillium dahliae]